MAQRRAKIGPARSLLAISFPTSFAPMLKRLVKNTPVVRTLARKIMRMTAARHQAQFVSGDYWEQRYKAAGSSGAGSYNRLARYKAEVLNEFVSGHGIKSVIEFGSGDGAQLQLAHYPSYIGVDVSPTAVALTRKLYVGDQTKRFLHVDDWTPEITAELSLSLDVIYHLIEDRVYEEYMRRLFEATRYVIVYSSDTDRKSDSVHVRHRKFTDWVQRNRPDFELIEVLKNPYPEDIRDIDNTSFADFFFFARKSQA